MLMTITYQEIPDEWQAQKIKSSKLNSKLLKLQTFRDYLIPIKQIMVQNFA